MDVADNKIQNVPSAPPAPQEVKVRTMKSDVASVAASGGGFPQFQNVPLTTTQGKKNDPNLLTIIVSVVVVIVAIAVIYFGYLAFQKQLANQTPVTTEQ